MREKHVSSIQGFSLVELLIVLVVLGLVLATAVVGTSLFMRSSRFGGAVNTLMADVQETHAQAKAQRRTIQIVFTSAKYSIVQTAPLDTLRRRTLPRNVSCTASGSATFFPWGLATPVDVTVTDGQRTRVIRVSANGSVIRV